MRKLFVVFIATLLGCTASAQQSVSLRGFKMNAIKLNLLALPMKNLSLQYERSLKENISLALGLRLQPKGSVPFQGTLRKSVEENNDNDTSNAGIDFINNASISSWAITPEIRYYFGQKPTNGFYIAPFVRIGGYGIEWNYKYEKDNGTEKPIHLKGRSVAFSGGILFGVQWHLGKNLLIDWWILGPQYGSYSINLDATGDFSDLTDKEKQDLEKIIEEVGYQGNKFRATVSNTLISADNKVSLPGLRTGLCIGYTF